MYSLYYGVFIEHAGNILKFVIIMKVQLMLTSWDDACYRANFLFVIEFLTLQITIVKENIIQTAYRLYAQYGRLMCGHTASHCESQPQSL
jgi:hypothetical protein